MSGEAESIKKSLIQILGLDGIYQDVIPCKVVSVEDNLCQCTTLAGEKEIVDVRISSEVDATNLLVIPSVDSAVMVGMIDDVNGVVVMYGKLDSIALRGAQFGGLVEVVGLVNKINALENLVNNILNTLKSTTIPLAPSGTYPFAPLYALLTDIAPITVRGDIENTNVTHG